MGKVYLIGAGPGDPELLTLKGKRILEQADVVFYDFLVSPELLKFTSERCEKICVGKCKGYEVKPQNEINELLDKYSKTHAVVVRLKGGTPFMFGKGYEELLFLRSRDIPCEVIPGVCAATAVPEHFGIPITLSQTFSSVAFCSGHWENKADIPVPTADILIYFMALTNIQAIAERLIESGRDPKTFCAVLSRGTLPDAKMVTGNLNNIARQPRLKALLPPAMFLVGTMDFERYFKSY